MKRSTAVASLVGALLWLQHAVALPNANHIFNSVHAAMRQWGSSLHHNGMSYYLVTVPAGTLLYHGTSQNCTEMGMEWVAFEPEHALAFAWAAGPPPKQPPPDDGSDVAHHSHTDSADKNATPLDQGLVDMANPQVPLRHDDDMPEPPCGYEGFLHTYRTKRDIQLLYLDGQSAAKSDKGTLDTQDFVLVNGYKQERERARDMCTLIDQEWNSQLAGVLRMEHGFEIILCSFAKTLDLVRVAAVNVTEYQLPYPEAMAMNLLRNIATRFHGIGGRRVRVYWDSLVTAYTHPLPAPGGSGQSQLQWPTNNTEHRLSRWPKVDLAQLRTEVVSSIRHALNQPPSDRVDWQSIADMIIERYALWLRALLEPRYMQDPAALWQELRLELRPFIDLHARNTTLEALRCSQQFLPPPDWQETHLAAQAVSHIALTVCETIGHAVHDLELALNDQPSDFRCSTSAAIKRIRDLMDYLQWTTWKECVGCADDEACAIAIWPRGGWQDHDQPRCANASQYSRSGRSYWFDF